ncbi:MAG: serine/threonine protein kinase, partial [Actinomycetota bacterium]
MAEGREDWGLAEGDEIVSGRHVLERLGGGRRYEAYLAWDEGLYSLVVVKVLRPGQVDDRRALDAIAAEAAVLEGINHPVIVRGFGLFLDGPRPHLVLEHIEGPRLSTLLRKYSALPPEQWLPLALQICSALHYLRIKGVVHLDVKPSNIIMGA